MSSGSKLAFPGRWATKKAAERWTAKNPPEAIRACILHLSGIIGDNDVMNAQTLPKVGMPNRDGFVPFAPAK